MGADSAAQGWVGHSAWKEGAQQEQGVVLGPPSPEQGPGASASQCANITVSLHQARTSPAPQTWCPSAEQVLQGGPRGVA